MKRYSVRINRARVDQWISDEDAIVLEFDDLNQAEQTAIDVAKQSALVTLHDRKSRYQGDISSVIQCWKRGFAAPLQQPTVNLSKGETLCAS